MKMNDDKTKLGTAVKENNFFLKTASLIEYDLVNIW